MAEVEEEIKNLIELTNKVRRSSFAMVLPLVVIWGIEAFRIGGNIIIIIISFYELTGYTSGWKTVE